MGTGVRTQQARPRSRSLAAVRRSGYNVVLLEATPTGKGSVTVRTSGIKVSFPYSLLVRAVRGHAGTRAPQRVTCIHDQRRGEAPRHGRVQQLASPTASRVKYKKYAS